MVFTLQRGITQQEEQALGNVVRGLVKLAADCPHTLICKHPKVPDFVAEFKQEDNACKVYFYKRNAGCTGGPYAYKVDQQFLKKALTLGGAKYRIALVFDMTLPAEDYKY